METVQIDDLQMFEELEGSILSAEGVRLISAGDSLNEQAIAALREFEFVELIVTDSERAEDEAIREARYQLKPLSELEEDELVAVPIFDNDDRLLVQAKQTIPASQRESLAKAGITEVYIEKPLPPEVELRLARFFMRMNELRKQTRALRMKLKRQPSVEVEEERIITDPASINEENLDKEAEAGGFDDQPKGQPLKATIETVDPLHIRPVGKVKAMVEVHDSVLRNAEQIFAQIRANKQVDGALISRLSNSAVTGLINDPNLVLNLAGITNSDYYLISHSVNTVLLSVTIATEMGYSVEQIHELAFGALLHDVGMMRLPKELIYKEEPLSGEERRELQRHPVIGINILQSISRLPKTTPLIVYQENERMDGSGYPRRRKAGLVHAYAKIVAVASAYEAMTSDRPHRKAMLPYHAMEELLKNVKEGKFQSEVVRALLDMLSLFPVGSWVRFNDGSRGRIVGSNPTTFTRPVVSVVQDGHGKRVEPPVPVDLSNEENSDLKIVQPIEMPEEFAEEARTVGF